VSPLGGESTSISDPAMLEKREGICPSSNSLFRVGVRFSEDGSSLRKADKGLEAKTPFSAVAQTVGFSLRKSKMLCLSMGID
jgi:hypothetical protein